MVVLEETTLEKCKQHNTDNFVLITSKENIPPASPHTRAKHNNSNIDIRGGSSGLGSNRGRRNCGCGSGRGGRSHHYQLGVWNQPYP